MRMTEMTAVELSAAIRAGQVTAVEAVEEMLAGIEERDALYNCYVTVDREGALAQAQAVQAQIEAGELTGPLAGVPVAVKDNLCTKGLRTTCSSHILYNFVPAYTAQAVENLERAGAVIIDRTYDVSLREYSIRFGICFLADKLYRIGSGILVFYQ